MEKINKEKALKIAKKHATRVEEPDIFSITDSLPSNCVTYGAPTKDCWYILCSYIVPLTSSGLICVSKTTGKVVFSGPC